METSISKKPFGFYVCSMAFTFERFAFYSAKWLMTIFVAMSFAEGGLGLTSTDAAKMSANLVAFTYLAPLLGSYLSDYKIGARYLVPVGMTLMGVGYLVGWQATSAFQINLMITLVSIGTGLFKSQTNAITGRLFDDESLLDGAFSTQYSFVNLGSFIGTTIIGVLALQYGHQFCLLICGIIMFVDAIWFVFGWRYLGEAGKKPFKVNEVKAVEEKKEEQAKPLTELEKKRIAAIVLVSGFSIVFWVFWYLAYMPIYFHWGEGAANWMIGSFEVPTAWFDSLNALGCIVLGPILGMIWTKRAQSPKGDWNMFQKTALGIILLGVSYAILAFTEIIRGGEPASLLWIALFGIVLTLGEMVFSPLGNSFITKFAPPKLLSTMMAVWVVAVFFAGKSYGDIYAFTLKFPFAPTYFIIAAITLVCGAILWMLSGRLQKLVIEEEQ